MDPGRQRLSQRRKAAALAQGSRADLLVPEPATAARRETGDTEAPPPAGMNVASAPRVVRQLADLFTASETDATPAPSTNAEGTIRALPPEVQRATSESEVLIRPQRAAKPAPTYRPSRAAIPARPRRLKRLPAAGLLAAALAGGTTSVLVTPHHSVPAPPDAAGTPALTVPVAAIPAPDPGSGNSPHSENAVGAARSATVAEPNKPVDGATSSSANTVTRAPDTQSEHQIPIRRKPPSSPAVTTPSSTRPTPAEAYDAWARAAGLDPSDQRWSRFRPEPKERSPR